MSKIIVIVGPTACGKTKLSIEIAKYFDAEIINSDAVQIYKDINIGTAKITKEEMEGIKHHLIDFVPLDKKYTLFNYQKDARKVLDSLIVKNRNVVIVGGTGLYIKALLYDYELQSEEERHLDKYNLLSNEELKEKINQIYPENEIHVNNRHRLLRFITHYENTGNIIQNKKSRNKPLYNFDLIGLKVDKEILYNRINQRVDLMFEKGFLSEAEDLYKKGVNTSSIIGYKELNDFFTKNKSLDEAKEEIKKNTRHYAKRQYTWFNNQFNNINWIEVNYSDFNKTVEETINTIKKSSND